MNKLILQNNEPTIENVLQLIKLIKSIEHQKGLSDDEIIRKYTHFDCRCLVSMVQQIIPNTKSILFILDEEFFHYFVGIPLEIQGNNESSTTYNGMCYFDINGIKTYEEACSFVLKEFNGEMNNITIMEASNIILENDITQDFLNSIDCQCQGQGLTI